MPRSYDPSTYPEEFWALAQQVRVDNPVEISFENAERAHALRFTWYGFVHALKKSKQDAYAKCAGIEVVIRSTTGYDKPNTTKLIFRSRDDPDRWPELKAAVQALSPEGATEEMPNVAEQTAKNLFD